jgi:hypothetical protein
MKSTYTEIIGVPHYQQGDADGLCVYYAMSMVLVALYPEYYRTIHIPPRGKKGVSPIFLMLKKIAQDNKIFHESIGKWYFNGMKLSDATRILNEIASKSYKKVRKDYFLNYPVQCRNIEKRNKVWKVSEICNALSWHLPVIIAGGRLQSHAVVAVGWGKEGKKYWITYQNPARGRVDSELARDIFYDDCEAIVPNQNYFLKHRPPVVITRDDESKYEAWDPEMWPRDKV